MGFPGGASGKESACQYGRHKRHGFIPGSGRSPGGGHGNPIPVFLPGESHGQVCQATDHTVAKSQSQLKGLSMHNRDI